jgi:hypothetical protein
MAIFLGSRRGGLDGSLVISIGRHAGIADETFLACGMDPANRGGELVAQPASERTRLCKGEVVRAVLVYAS